jgi:hypothetical protein
MGKVISIGFCIVLCFSANAHESGLQGVLDVESRNELLEFANIIPSDVELWSGMSFSDSESFTRMVRAGSNVTRVLSSLCKMDTVTIREVSRRCRSCQKGFVTPGDVSVDSNVRYLFLDRKQIRRSEPCKESRSVDDFFVIDKEIPEVLLPKLREFIVKMVSDISDSDNISPKSIPEYVASVSVRDVVGINYVDRSDNIKHIEIIFRSCESGRRNVCQLFSISVPETLNAHENMDFRWYD